DPGRPGAAAAGEECDHVAVGQEAETERPPEGVVRLRLPAVEVDRGQVRSCLEQENVLAALGELARDHAAAGAGPDHDDLEVVLHDTPSHDQSLRSRAVTGGAKSISSQALGPSLPGATKSL